MRNEFHNIPEQKQHTNPDKNSSVREFLTQMLLSSGLILSLIYGAKFGIQAYERDDEPAPMPPPSPSKSWHIPEEETPINTKKDVIVTVRSQEDTTIPTPSPQVEHHPHFPDHFASFTHNGHSIEIVPSKADVGPDAGRRKVEIHIDGKLTQTLLSADYQFPISIDPESGVRFKWDAQQQRFTLAAQYGSPIWKWSYELNENSKMKLVEIDLYQPTPAEDEHHEKLLNHAWEIFQKGTSDFQLALHDAYRFRELLRYGTEQELESYLRAEYSGYDEQDIQFILRPQLRLFRENRNELSQFRIDPTYMPDLGPRGPIFSAAGQSLAIQTDVIHRIINGREHTDVSTTLTGKE